MYGLHKSDRTCFFVKTHIHIYENPSASDGIHSNYDYPFLTTAISYADTPNACQKRKKKKKKRRKKEHMTSPTPAQPFGLLNPLTPCAYPTVLPRA